MSWDASVVSASLVGIPNEILTWTRRLTGWTADPLEAYLVRTQTGFISELFVSRRRAVYSKRYLHSRKSICSGSRLSA